MFPLGPDAYTVLCVGGSLRTWCIHCTVCRCMVPLGPEAYSVLCGDVSLRIWSLYFTMYHHRPVARGGRTTPPPQLPIPKILFHPLAILFHLLAILFHLSAILFHPLAILFHPSAILFHPWNMWMTSHGQCPRGGGGACECPRVGAFFKLMTSHGQCPRGGCACECPRVGAFFKLMTSRGQCPRGGGALGVPPIQVQTPPPHLAGWLRAWGGI